MTGTIHYEKCPVCGTAQLTDVFRVTDHTVSKEQFSIVECRTCSLRVTQDVPGESFITPYYRSDDYISHTDTSRGLINNLYHRVRNITLQKKRKLVQRATGLGKGILLDVGSGIGAFVHEMDQHGWRVEGLEPDASARRIANEKFMLDLKEPHLLFEFGDESFDAITLWHVLEHVHSLHEYVEQLKRLLRPGGRLFIAVPNYTSADAAHYGSNWAAYDVPRHLYHFSPVSMKKLVELHGMKIVEKRPMWYDSYYISLLSSRYKTGKTSFAGAMWNGSLSNFKAFLNGDRCSSIIYIISK